MLDDDDDDDDDDGGDADADADGDGDGDDGDTRETLSESFVAKNDGSHCAGVFNPCLMFLEGALRWHFKKISQRCDKASQLVARFTSRDGIFVCSHCQRSHHRTPVDLVLSPCQPGMVGLLKLASLLSRNCLPANLYLESLEHQEPIGV